MRVGPLLLQEALAEVSDAATRGDVLDSRLSVSESVAVTPRTRTERALHLRKTAHDAIAGARGPSALALAPSLRRMADREVAAARAADRVAATAVGARRRRERDRADADALLASFIDLDGLVAS